MTRLLLAGLVAVPLTVAAAFAVLIREAGPLLEALHEMFVVEGDH